MRRDRIADHIHVFVSDSYLQVTSTVVATQDGAVVIDAMPFLAEARQIAEFVRSEHGTTVRYVAYTHHHADHVYGACVFEDAQVIAQDQCRRILAKGGQAALSVAKAETPALAEVTLRLPNMTVQGSMQLQLGDEVLRFDVLPGHTVDGMSVLAESEGALVAGDAMMPVPYFARGGDRHQLAASLKKVEAQEPDFVVQGHGSVMLRGEVEETIVAHLEYLRTIEERVGELVASGAPPSSVRDIDIESCGLSRIPLDGMVSRLHLDNLVSLYREMSGL